MSRHLKTRVFTSTLIASFIYSPILGTYTGTVAAAQAVQNTTSSFAYDGLGNLTQVTDPLGRVTKLNYDALSRLKQQIQPVPATGLANPTTNITYDGLDQISTVADPRNLTTAYTNDGLGNQQNLASPDTGATTRTYDGAGNVLTSTDARGKVTMFTYDSLGRVTSVAYFTGVPTAFEYDGGAAGAPNAIGHLTKMTDESGHTSYGYDQMGNLINKMQTINSTAGIVSLAVSYGYSNNGKLVSLTYPSGSRVNYSFDAAGNVSNLTLNPSDSQGGTDIGTVVVLLDQISYAPMGPVQGWVWGNNSETSPNAYARTFDLDGRVVTYPLGSSSGVNSGVVRTVTYDASSRIISMSHTGIANAANYDQSFGYDGLDRLTSYVNSTGTQTYAYDASGNRTQLGIGANGYAYTTSPSSNRLAATSGPLPAKTLSYDAAGNLGGDGVASYTYSDRGRLKSASKNGVAASYLYNGLGQRVLKTGASVTSGVNEYVYDEQGRLLGEYGANGALLQETIYLGDLPVAVLKRSAVAGSPSVYYIYADHINTPRLITDSVANTPVWNWIQADPFGGVQPGSMPFRVEFDIRRHAG